jgi:hypothetical protein
VETIQTYTPSAADLAVPRQRALIAGGAGVVACVLAVLFDRDNFFRSWLIAYLTFLSIALGSLALMMIQHLSGGQWGVFRRIFEASSRTMPLLVVLFIPVLLGLHTLYPWTHADLVRTDEVMRHRVPYLNMPFFLARNAIYFISWLALTFVLDSLSRRQDRGDVAINTRIQRLCGAGIVIYAMTVMFAGIDWIMVLNAHWFSTIFGFLMMAGHGLAALAFTILAANYLFPRPPMSNLLRPSHFHDLGKLMLAFVMLWAYFNFSQYLLTYAANLVEEVPYMIVRIHNGWQILALFLVVFHFAVPFLLLLSRNLKRRPRHLVAVALWMLIARYIDLYMMVSPEFLPSGVNLHMVPGEQVSRFFFHWTDLAAPLAIGGLWVWMFFIELAKRPLFAVGDPYLRESLANAGGH